MNKKRCPNGTRKNKKTGLCEKNLSLEIKNLLKKVPKGVEEQKISLDDNEISPQQQILYLKQPSKFLLPRYSKNANFYFSQKKSVENKSPVYSEEPKKISVENPTPSPQLTKKRSRCPKGTRKNKLTGLCEKKVNNLLKRHTQKKNVQSNNKKRSRCPKGTRKNKLTGLCEKKVNNLLKTPTKYNLEETKNNLEETKNNMNIISDSITNIFKKNSKAIPINLYDNINIQTINNNSIQITNIIKDETIISGTFTPSINKLLLSIRSVNTNEQSIFNCGIEDILMNKQPQNIKNKLLVNIGDNINKICVDARSKKAIDLMLKKYKRDRKLDINRIILPVQVLSNCWFNVSFATFFISDKGKQFMRIFRETMITGKTLSGKKIPKKIHNTLIIFNACIESCYNYDNTFNFPFIFNTNHIVINLYKQIKQIKDSEPLKRIKYMNEEFYNINEAGNPKTYYTRIFNYLYDKNEPFLKMEIFKINDEVAKRRFFNKRNLSYLSVIPDMLIIPLHATTEKYKKKKEITLKTGEKYMIDSAQLIDWNIKIHFTSLLTINNKEYKYDGDSLVKLTEFKWKHLVNKDKDWTFKYEKDVSPLYFNFKKSYQILYYYRVK